MLIGLSESLSSPPRMKAWPIAIERDPGRSERSFEAAVDRGSDHRFLAGLVNPERVGCGSRIEVRDRVDRQRESRRLREGSGSRGRSVPERRWMPGRISGPWLMRIVESWLPVISTISQRSASRASSRFSISIAPSGGRARSKMSPAMIRQIDLAFLDFVRKPVEESLMERTEVTPVELAAEVPVGGVEDPNAVFAWFRCWRGHRISHRDLEVGGSSWFLTGSSCR